MIPIGLIKCNLVVPAATRSRFSLKHLMHPEEKGVFHVQCFKQTCPRTCRDRGNICFCIGPRLCRYADGGIGRCGKFSH